MRWQSLFDDLEGELAAAAAAEQRLEVADRTRREAARLRVVDRLRPALGHPVHLLVAGAGDVAGRLVDLGPDWLLLQEGAAREVLVPLAALETAGGLSARSSEPGSEGAVTGRLTLGYALRGLTRARAAVQVTLHSGQLRTGTMDRVGADFVELAVHPPGEPRRREMVRETLLVPLARLALVRSG